MPHALWLVISLSVVTCNPTTLRPYGQKSGKYQDSAPLPPIYNTLSDVQKYPPSEYTEQIFLPIAAKNYHPQKTHESLGREPKEFDLLNFSAYTVRPSNKSMALRKPWTPREEEESEEVTENPRERLMASNPPKDFPAPSYVTFYGKILPRIGRLPEQEPERKPKPLRVPRPKPRRSMRLQLGNPTANPTRMSYFEYPTSTPRYNDELRATKQTNLYGDVEFIHPTVGRAKDVDRARLVQFEDSTEKNQELEAERDVAKRILYDDIFYHPEVKKKHKRRTPKLASYKKSPYTKKPNDGDFSFVVLTGDKNMGKNAKLKSALKNFPAKKRELGIITNTTKVYYNFEHSHKPNKEQASASDHYETTLPNPEVSDATEKYSSKYRTPKWENVPESPRQQRNPPFLPTALTPLVRIERPDTEYPEYDQKEANSDQKNVDSDSVQQYFQDLFRFQLEPHAIEFGHVMENPRHWEERYERNDMKTNRHQGKVRWGDKEGGYGEHVWDLNHHKGDTT